MQKTATATDTPLGPEASLPTLSKLGHPHIPEDLDDVKIASDWLDSFAKCAGQGDVDGLLGLLITSSFALNFFTNAEHVDPSSPYDIPLYWRDILALSWDIRTFEGTPKIKQFLSSQLSSAEITNVKLQTDIPPQLQRPFPDLAWIQVLFKFETKAGLCSGVVKLVPVSNKESQELTWKAHSIFTNLEDLKGFPEKLGLLRNQQPNHGKWESAATQDPETKVWSVTVKKADGGERVFKVKHVVLAMGFKGGQPYIPEIPGKASFKGQVLHSLQHEKATDHAGKKVVVIGSCTSAHDICVDYADHGIDVTMFQRSSTYIMSAKKGIPMLLGGLYSENGPPTELADRLNNSMPNLLMAGITYRMTNLIADADKETLDGLHKRGFRTNAGFKDCGLLFGVFTKAGGYYMDMGGSQYIIDGRIKLKNDSQIKGFIEGGLKFEDGSELSADVVVFCTGLGDPRDSLRKLFGDEVADKSTQMWGLNEEGELSGCYRDIGFPGLYNIQGNLALCRFFSKTLALQIKAIEEGVFGNRYSSK